MAAYKSSIIGINEEEQVDAGTLARCVSPVPGIDLHDGLLKEEKTNNRESKKLFFSLYYKVEDNAFKLASETWKKSLNLDFGSVYIGLEFTTERSFKESWRKIYQDAKTQNLVAVEGHVFSHSSHDKSLNRRGIEFMADKDEAYLINGNTLKSSEILSLEKLPWDKYKGELVLHGCNSGREINGWVLAQKFANGQGVSTKGQVGFAFFSKQENKYKGHEGIGSNTKLYLWAYEHSDNTAIEHVRQRRDIEPVVFLPTGNKIQAKTFRPLE